MRLIIKSAERVRGKPLVGGDKSITHRAFILASLAKDDTVIHNYSDCQDCMSTLHNMTLLGATIQKFDSDIVITGNGLHGLTEPGDILDCGNSGTTMRILAGVLAGQKFHAVLTGDNSLRSRPMARVVEPLIIMGADIRGREKGKFAPLSIMGSALMPIDYSLPVASAQVKSCLIMAGLYAQGQTIVRESKLTRDHTERMIHFMGGKCQKENNTIYISPVKQLYGQDIFIPGDISSAAYFLVLGALAPYGHISMSKIGLNPSRTGILDVLKQMGACVQIGSVQEKNNEPSGNMTITDSQLHGICIRGDIIPRLIDEIPIIAVAATQAKGITEIRNARELRVKETDRISAITTELNKMDALIDEYDDGLVIHGPRPLKGAVVDSHNDHRIAMSLAIAGLIAQGETIIENSECIAVSFPDFMRSLRQVCGEKDIVIED